MKFLATYKIALTLVLIFAVAAITTEAQTQFKAGDKVEVTNPENPGTWIKATVIIVDVDGSYGHKGEYIIQFDGETNTMPWLKSQFIRSAGQGSGNDVGEVFKMQFKAGAKIEALDRDNPGRWARATVIIADIDGGYGHKGQYTVQFDGQVTTVAWLKANEVRNIGEAGPIVNPPKPPAEGPPNTQGENNTSGALKVGDRVDVYYSMGEKPAGKNRGTILEINGNKVKVHPDGCAAYWDRDQDANLLLPAATIEATAPDIKFLVGKWAMTTVGISSSAVAWGKSEGLQINGDGTYVWFQGGGKPPLKGNWEPHAKIQNAQYGTEVLNGIVIKDVKGQLWKMTRRISTLDNADHITITIMCSGETELGTRAK